MQALSDIEDPQRQLKAIGLAEIEAQTWNLAVHTSDNAISIIKVKPTTSVLTPDAINEIRGNLYDRATKDWRLRLLIRLSAIEVGVAKVEGVLRKEPLLEVAIHHYLKSPFLTMALRRPEVLKEDVMIYLSPSTSVTAGSKVIVFRTAYDYLQKVLKLCMVAAIGLFLGCLAGLAARKVDVGIAVAAAWLQLAQLFQTYQHS